MNISLNRYKVLFLFCLMGWSAWCADWNYLCEIGPLGGGSYYVGDATPHIFRHVQPTYGALFRYKFDPRWALAVKGQGTQIAYESAGELSKNALAQLDAVAEFNFFKLELKGYDRMAKPYSPYIFAGIGATVFLSKSGGATGYLPFGFGFKWKMSPRWSLDMQWQQQLFFFDRAEGTDEFDNTYNMNGTNFLKNDMLSTFTIGVTFGFWREKKICRICDR